MTGVTGEVARWLDWRAQFGALTPHLGGKGGVVHVQAGPDAPSCVFVNAVRSRLRESRERPWSCVVVDSGDPAAGHLLGVVNLIARALDLPVSWRRLAGAAGRDVAVGEVTGDLVLSDTLDDAGRELIEADLVRELSHAMAAHLRDRGIALLLHRLDLLGRERLTRLRQYLWTDGLDRLVAHGLLVVDVSDRRRPRDLATWPPSPGLYLELPDDFEGEDLEHAREDLARLALRHAWVTTAEQAEEFAGAVVDGHRSVREVYADLCHAHWVYGTDPGLVLA